MWVAKDSGGLTLFSESSRGPSSSAHTVSDAEMAPASDRELSKHQAVTVKRQPLSPQPLTSPAPMLVDHQASGATGPASNSSSEKLTDSTLEPDCAICEDRATGKHYGAPSCDGCKGFFRRSVRKSHQYTCRFDRNCVITRDSRNQCRYCRLRKCFRVGMKKEAVQNERDRISKSRDLYMELSSQDGTVTFYSLIQADRRARQLEAATEPNRELLQRNVAGLAEVVDSMRQQLLILVEWAKYLPCFVQLAMEDQLALLRSHGAEHLLLGVARRSIGLHNILLLGNNHIIPRDAPDETISVVANRVLSELIPPLREVCIDEQEHACMKAIIFFDPNARGVVDRMKIRSIRWHIQTFLQDYVEDRQYEPKGRFGEILLILPTLQAIASSLVEQVQFVKLFNDKVQLDSLLQEMLLGDTNGAESLESNGTSPGSSLDIGTDLQTSTGTSAGVENQPSSTMAPQQTSSAIKAPTAELDINQNISPMYSSSSVNAVPPPNMSLLMPPFASVSGGFPGSPVATAQAARQPLRIDPLAVLGATLPGLNTASNAPLSAPPHAGRFTANYFGNTNGNQHSPTPMMYTNSLMTKF